MEMRKNLWTSSENKVLKVILNKEKAFLKYIVSFWGFGLFCTTSSTVGWQAELRKKYIQSNPALGDKLLIIGQAINIKCLHESHWDLSDKDKVIFLEKIYRLYNKTIAEKTVVHTLLKTPITQVWKELIIRGFIHPDDITDEGNFFLIEVVELVYKQKFTSINEALNIADKFAIPNRYKIILYGNKNRN